MTDLFSLKDSDWIFYVIKLATLIMCIPWPATILASIMSLAGHIPKGTSQFKIALARVFSLGLLFYPIVFFLWIKFAERIIATLYYPLGVMLSLLPLGLSSWLIYYIFFRERRTSNPN